MDMITVNKITKMSGCIYRYSACGNISHYVFILNAEEFRRG